MKDCFWVYNTLLLGESYRTQLMMASSGHMFTWWVMVRHSIFTIGQEHARSYFSRCVILYCRWQDLALKFQGTHFMMGTQVSHWDLSYGISSHHWYLPHHRVCLIIWSKYEGCLHCSQDLKQSAFLLCNPLKADSLIILDIDVECTNSRDGRGWPVWCFFIHGKMHIRCDNLVFTLKRCLGTPWLLKIYSCSSLLNLNKVLFSSSWHACDLPRPLTC